MVVVEEEEGIAEAAEEGRRMRTRRNAHDEVAGWVAVAAGEVGEEEEGEGGGEEEGGGGGGEEGEGEGGGGGGCVVDMVMRSKQDNEILFGG